MRVRTCACPTILAIALSVVLSACGGLGVGGGAQQAMSEKPFTGHEARAAEDLDEIVANAIEQGEELTSGDDDTEEGELVDSVADTFSEANHLYREGDYEAAAELYKDVLADYSLHCGANVNLTLAQLQLSENEDALLQALTCVYLFPDDAGCLLNAQATATACGFGEADIEDALCEVLKAADDYTSDFDSYWQHYGLEDSMKSLFGYNSTWNRMETELAVGDEQGSDASVRDAYDSLAAELDEFENLMPDDPDGAQLRAYLDAVGTQLGLREEQGSGASSDASAG